MWQRDAWLDLLARFIHVELPAEGSKVEKREGGGSIFPRFHQWDAVLRLEADAREQGAGQNYLVQHSAGSGKSNTIAWLAHRLSTLHDDADEKVFDKVVVITDRVVLDRQLQETIYQFEHATASSRRSTRTPASSREALSGEQARIIITTLQKFPFILDKVGELPQRRYAVIVDEAHSSQTGEAAKDLKLALGQAADERRELAAAEAEDLAEEEARGDGGGRPGPAGGGARAAAEPELLRVHGDAEGADARTVRHARPGRRPLSSRSTCTRCGRPSRRASSSTCSPTTRPTRRTSGSRRRSATTRSTRRRRLGAPSPGS